MVQQVLVIAALIVAFPTELSAQTVCGPQDYDSKTTPDFGCPSPGEEALMPNLNSPDAISIRTGSSVKAPWDGAMVHRNRLLELGLRIKALRRLRWAERLKMAGECKVNMDHYSKVSDIRIEDMKLRVDSYRELALVERQRAKRYESWWRSPTTWFAIGVATAGVVVALAAYGLSAVGD